MGFDPCNCSQNLVVHGDSNSQSGSSLVSMKCDSWTSLLAHTLASLCFGYKPKARVAIMGMEKCEGNDDICITSLGAQRCWAILWVLRNFWPINCSLLKNLLDSLCKVLKF